MIRKTLGLAALVMVVFAFCMILPVSAADVDTSACINGGTGGMAPIVKCKWEQIDLCHYGTLEDGDPRHRIPGSQFLPNATFEGEKWVWYYAVVTDNDGWQDIMTVAADVWHPDNDLGGDGSFKYQVLMVDWLPKDVSVMLFKDAANAGLIEYSDNFDYAEVLNEIEKGTAWVYFGAAKIHYCQPAGDYKVQVHAVDLCGGNSNVLENTFRWVPTSAAQFDFTQVDYGTIKPGFHVMRAGDTIFDTSDKPTVRNVGNVPIRINIEQDDMGLGKSTSFGKDVWNVYYDARMGNDDANLMNYAPYDMVTLPNPLLQCHTDELDFSIIIEKGMPGCHSGQMTLGWETAYI